MGVDTVKLVKSVVLGNTKIRLFKDVYSWSSKFNKMFNPDFGWYKVRLGKVEYTLTLANICEHRWQTYSYTTEDVVENGQTVTKYARRNQYCTCGRSRVLKGE